MTEQRVAIVTGASRGIGRAIAERLAEDGRLVVGVARTVEGLSATAEAIAASGGRFEAHACDIADSSAVTALMDAIAEKHGRLDILVNNAGLTRDGLILRMSDEDFDLVIQTNLKGVFSACRTACRHMMRGRFGRICNMSSVSGISGNAGQTNYAAAKAGIIGLTKSIAKELGTKGVTANVIAPGFIDTDMTSKLPQSVKDMAIASIPVRRFGSTADIAQAVSYVTSDGAGFLSGHVLVVDGGMTM
ncbi:MAG: 3-oxoacyl-[acyl-carrier-protein] reductase [Planctomycetota bacterium]|nr:3-oxoacyl-[acyl-carrier-protein] reductase [Planctomycetota bacterium]